MERVLLLRLVHPRDRRRPLRALRAVGLRDGWGLWAAWPYWAATVLGCGLRARPLLRTWRADLVPCGPPPVVLSVLRDAPGLHTVAHRAPGRAYGFSVLGDLAVARLWATSWLPLAGGGP